MAAVECGRRLCAYPGCDQPVRGKRRDSNTCGDKHRKYLQRLVLVRKADDAEAVDELTLDAIGDASVFEAVALLDESQYGRLVELIRSDEALTHLRDAA